MAFNQTMFIMLLIVSSLICNTHQMPANGKRACLGMCQHEYQQCLAHSPYLGNIKNCQKEERKCIRKCEKAKKRARRSVLCSDTCVAVIASCFKSSGGIKACIKTVHPTCLERCNL